MNIKCPYCKGVSEAETKPEVGETLQCPYCSRTFLFGQEISKPTRIEIPMGLSGSRRSAATAESIAPQSSPVVQGRSVKRSNFARTNSRTACETKSGWLHNHIAIVFGIGGAVIVGLIVLVIALLLREGDGRIESAGESIAVESMSGKVDVEALVANVKSAVTNGVARDDESAKKDVVKLEQPKAVPMPPNNKHVDKRGDFSTPEEKVDGDDFASNDTDDEADPFDPDSADDDDDPYSSNDDMASDGKGKSDVSSAENKAQLDGPYFGLRWDQDINKLPDEFFRLNDKGRRESVDGEFRCVIYRPPYKHRWFLGIMGKNDVGIALDDNGRIKRFICIHEREEKEGPDAKEYVARLSKMGEETLKEFRNLIAFFQGSPGWRLDRKIADEMYRFRNDDEVFADVSLSVAKGFTLLSVCIFKDDHAGDETGIMQSTKRTLESREEIKSEYATLKKEHAVLVGAISQLDMIPDPARSVYSLSQLLGNYSLGRAYDKWSGKKWGEFAEKMLQEIGESDRKFQVPTHSPGVSETKLNALSSTLEGLKKEFSKLGRKGGVRQSELKSQIDSKQKEIDGLKKKVDREIAKEELAIEKVKEGRNEAFAGIIASIKNRIEEDSLKPLKVKLEAQEKAYADVIEEEKREAAERNRRAEEAREAERKKIEPIYKKRKAWYEAQLEYNGLKEAGYAVRAVNGGEEIDLVYLTTGYPCKNLTIEAYPVSGQPGRFEMRYSRDFPKGLAEELVMTRLFMYKFENPNWEKDLKEEMRRQAEAERRQAEEEEKKNRYKVYTPKRRRIDPSLKRFKGPGGR